MSLTLALSAALTGATVLLWASARLPEYLVALLFFACASVLQLVPPEVLYAGFAAPAFWLVLSGFVLGTAIREVGLADRLARQLACHLRGGWWRLVGGVVALTYALAFVMPSNMGRIALLMPLVLALADQAGLGAGSRGRTALALAVGVGTFQLSASILPANVPNLVMAGAIQTTYGVSLSYLPYLLWHAPVLGLLKGVALVACLCLLFPARPQWAAAQADAEPLPPCSAAQRRLAGLLLLTLLLWVTDGVHGIAPAWVGLVAACICLLPRVGFLTGDAFASGVNIRTCLYVAGILGLAALVQDSGLGAWLGTHLVALLPFAPGQEASNTAALVALTSVLNGVVTANGVPALFTPLAGTLAEATGLPLLTVLMWQVVGYATPLLPYQASPIVVAMGMGGVAARDGIRLCLGLAAITAVVLVPLDYLWFGWVGLR